MMESPKMSETLAGKKSGGEDPQAANGPVLVKDDTLNEGHAEVDFDSFVSNVNIDVVSIEGKMKCLAFHDSACVVNEEGNLLGSLDKGTKCSDFGIDNGSENAEGEIKKDAIFSDSLKVLEDVSVQEDNISENVTEIGDVMDIPVNKLVDEERPQLVKDSGFKLGADQKRSCVGKQDKFDKEGRFSVGDLVWSTGKINTWWPGLICDPLDAPKQVMKSHDPYKLLVQHFGSKTMVWCPLSHLKNFLENFKEMSGQGNSKNFLRAIEKAAEEVGRRVKLEMTCSCISKDIRARLFGRNKDDFKPWYVSNESVAAHFDPTSFMQCVKKLSRMSYVPSIVETVAIQSTISSYYSYLGHSQLYLRHLREAEGPSRDASERTDDENDLANEEDSDRSDDLLMKEESSILSAGKEAGSRERKRSKYLSFPFVDPSITKALQDPIDLCKGYGKHTASISMSSVGKIRKYSSQSYDLKDLEVPQARVLKELREASQGSFYLSGNRILSSAFNFLCEFRCIVFKDGDNACNNVEIAENEGLSVLVASPLSKTKSAKERMTSVTNELEGLNNECRMDQVKDVHLNACSASRVAKKRKESDYAHQTNKTIGVAYLNAYGHAPKKQPETDPESNILPKKRKNERGITTSEHKVENSVVNANPISLVVDLFVDSSLLADLMEANVDTYFGESLPNLNSDTAPILAENLNPKDPESVNYPEQMYSDDASKIILENHALTTSLLPDLNSNGLVHSSSGKYHKHSLQPHMIPASQPASGDQALPLPIIRNNLNESNVGPVEQQSFP